MATRVGVTGLTPMADPSMSFRGRRSRRTLLTPSSESPAGDAKDASLGRVTWALDFPWPRGQLRTTAAMRAQQPRYPRYLEGSGRVGLRDQRARVGPRG